MKLSSTSFFNNHFIPHKYCSLEIPTGQNVSPQLSWGDFPNDTKSFLLTFINRDPKSKNEIHWLLSDIPSHVTKLPEGASNSSKLPSGVVELTNNFGRRGYTGPQPPKGRSEHYYEAIIYALDIPKAGISGETNEKKLLDKIKKNVLTQTVITGKLNIQ